MRAVCLLGGVVGFSSPLAAQFSVQPVIVSLAPATGSAAEVVTVANQGASPIQFSIYPGDFEQAEDGEHSFPGFGEHPRSCSGRLSVSPEAVTLQPGEQQQVVVRMEPGAETCWSLVFVERVAQERTGIWATERIGVKVYGTPAVGAREGEIIGVRASAAGEITEVEVGFENLSGLPLRPQGTLEVRTAAGELVHSQRIEAFSVLPGRRRRVVVAVQAQLAPGRYLAVPVLDFGGEYLAGGQAAFDVAAPGAAPGRP